jgi:hypothetical protein
MIETWKPVVGYEGLYEVSDFGRVRSLTRTTRAGKRHGRLRTHGVPNGRRGYPQLALCKDGKSTWVRVHVIVLEAFRGPRPKGMVACHNDGNPSNPVLANLRWSTATDNENDKRRHGTNLDQRGERNHASKLTEADVRRAIELRKAGNTLSAIAREIGASVGHVSEIVRGKTWGHVCRT